MRKGTRTKDRARGPHGGAKEHGGGRRREGQRDRATEAAVRGADTGCRQLGLDGGQRNQNCTVAAIYSALDWFPFRRRDRCHSLVLFPFGFKDFRGTSSAVSDVVTPTGNEGETVSTASTLSPLHPHGIPHDRSPPTPTQSPPNWPHLPRRHPWICSPCRCRSDGGQKPRGPPPDGRMRRDPNFPRWFRRRHGGRTSWDSTSPPLASRLLLPLATAGQAE